MLQIVKKNYLILGMMLLCVLYLGFEIFYNSYTMIATDEFWFAHAIYQYKDYLPYRDFPPYKTTFGYYLLLLPMKLTLYFTQYPLSIILSLKNYIAMLNALLFFIAGIWLSKFFSKTAVLSSFFLILFSEIVLSYSTNIRLDLLAYWFCLFSILCIFEKRFIVAGFLIGLGFLTSQKILWYIFATNLVLCVSWMFFERDRDNLKRIILFNLSMLLTSAIYIFIWAIFSDLTTVLNNIFFDAYSLHQLDWYQSASKLFWVMALYFNPLIFILWPLTFVSLLSFNNNAHYKILFFCVSNATIIMVCLILYKQMFPYNMLAVVPAFLLLYTAFFDWLFKLLQQSRLLLILIMIIVFAGVIAPFVIYIQQLPSKNGSYQKTMLATAYQLLQDQSDYLAGIEFFYNKNQKITGLRHLDGPQISFLYQNSEKLRPVAAMESLYHAAVTQQDVLSALKKSNIKFYINNYRIEALPPPLKKYLASEYKQAIGSIYLYAPTVISGKHFFKFAGNYRIESMSSVWIDGRVYQPQSIINLSKGDHTIRTALSVRLSLVFDGLINDLKDDQWMKVLG